MGGEDGWCVVGGIAVAQVARLQVEHTDEQRDKHIVVIAVANGLVHGLHDVDRLSGV